MSCVCVLQRGHSCDGCDLASTLFMYDLRKGDLFVMSWARARRFPIYKSSDKMYIFLTWRSLHE